MMKADVERFSKEYAAEEPAEGRLARVLQVDVPAWRDLANEILADLDDHAFGVRWWAPHPGTARRILISDHLFTCVTSVESNLIEARLHLIEAMDFWERESALHARAVSVTEYGVKVQLPPRRCPLDELTPAMSMLHTVGFIRAIAGALDCFGASLVGVAAVKTSLLRADLDLARRALSQVTGADAGDRIQADVRAQLEAFIERAGPPGWLRWTVDLRNTLIHRGRRLQLSELRPIPSRLVDPDGAPIIRTDVIHQLPRDPGRSDVEMLLDAANPPVLTEIAAATLRGVLDSTLSLTRDGGVLLLDLGESGEQTPVFSSNPASSGPTVHLWQLLGFPATRQTQFHTTRPGYGLIKSSFGAWQPPHCRIRSGPSGLNSTRPDARR
jgi:hypothetical protein